MAWFTYEIPDKYVLVKNPSWFESMVENLLQGCNQAIFST